MFLQNLVKLDEFMALVIVHQKTAVNENWVKDQGEMPVLIKSQCVLVREPYK